MTSCSATTWKNHLTKICVTAPTLCPTGYYADSTTSTCVATCPSSPSRFGENSTRLCQVDCSTGYKYIDTRVCIDVCPGGKDGLGLFGDPTDPDACVSSCAANGLFADSTTRLCVALCPAGSYSYSVTSTCVSRCPADSA